MFKTYVKEGAPKQNNGKAKDSVSSTLGSLSLLHLNRHTSSSGSGDTEPAAARSSEPAAEGAGAAPASSPAAPAPAPAANGSPVPARNTARVAAKFADLTLTGGSLKPALAAKPALLRRPTPHPVHARPHEPPTVPTLPIPTPDSTSDAPTAPDSTC
ncbi:transcriptional regulatory protein AlgP-like [Pectinophora gossypiella]|uniref:transcriptional regulatory protein AlgP-like n=1 Tax=Pectinophora gossypiella TaxID=13191 RepID=UPI00214E7588|nr:transcriptional regulatory protein AlgP-like [Pectinophora gossypiella]